MKNLLNKKCKLSHRLNLHQKEIKCENGEEG